MTKNPAYRCPLCGEWVAGGETHTVNECRWGSLVLNDPTTFKEVANKAREDAKNRAVRTESWDITSFSWPLAFRANALHVMARRQTGREWPVCDFCGCRDTRVLYPIWATRTAEARDVIPGTRIPITRQKLWEKISLLKHPDEYPHPLVVECRNCAHVRHEGTGFKRDRQGCNP